MSQFPEKQLFKEQPVLILGAGGMLAAALVELCEKRQRKFIALSIDDLDITEKNRVDAAVKEIRPATVINAAAYTDVDGAESECELAQAVNGTGAGNVAEAASRSGALMVHISTDYVFDGRKEGGYLPQDAPNPLNMYGTSKLKGEERVRQAGPNYLLVRTSWLFGSGGKNFVNTMLRLGQTRSHIGVVDDQSGSPTYSRHLARGVLEMIDKGVTGVCHLTNSGSCTWCAFAREIFRLADMPVEVNPILTEDFPRPAVRPRNSVLDCSATFEILDGPMPAWQVALGQYLEEIEETGSRAGEAESS